MSKIYFIVSPLGTRGGTISGELVDSYRKNAQLPVLKLLGNRKTIKNIDTRFPEETLGKIETTIAENNSADAIVFVGWRIPDHIDTIYAAYPSATYLFTKADAELNLHTHLKQYAGEEEIANLRVVQQSVIDTFISTNSISLTWNKVGEPAFDTSRNINVSATGNIFIAVHGTL